jgi:hypothetical protein
MLFRETLSPEDYWKKCGFRLRRSQKVVLYDVAITDVATANRFLTDLSKCRCLHTLHLGVVFPAQLSIPSTLFADVPLKNVTIRVLHTKPTKVCAVDLLPVLPSGLEVIELHFTWYGTTKYRWSDVIRLIERNRSTLLQLCLQPYVISGSLRRITQAIRGSNLRELTLCVDSNVYGIQPFQEALYAMAPTLYEINLHVMHERGNMGFLEMLDPRLPIHSIRIQEYAPCGIDLLALRDRMVNLLKLHRFMLCRRWNIQSEPETRFESMKQLLQSMWLMPGLRVISLEPFLQPWHTLVSKVVRRLQSPITYKLLAFSTPLSVPRCAPPDLDWIPIELIRHIATFLGPCITDGRTRTQ